MRSNFAAYTFRVAALSCGMAFLLSACGGDDTGNGGTGTGGTGGAAQDGQAGSGGTGGQDGSRADAAIDASRGGSTGAGGTDGQAGAGGMGGQDGSRLDGGNDAAIGGPLGLPWRSFLPLASVASGDGTSGGITSDVSGNGYNATFFGSTVGFSNSAMNLTGAGPELVIIPTKSGVPAIDVTGSFSVSVWVSLSTTTGYRTVVSGEGQAVASFYLQKRADTNSWAFAQFPTDSTAGAACVVPPPTPDAGNPVGVVGRITPVANTFYHLVATRDAATGVDILYVNGAESGRLTCASGWADTGLIGIGHGIFNTRGDNVAGAVAEVGLIDRVLTPAEVGMLYALGHVGAGAPDAAIDAADGSTIDANTADRSASDGAAGDGNPSDRADGTTGDSNASDGVSGEAQAGDSSTDAVADSAGQ